MNNVFFERSQLKHCGENIIIGKTMHIRYPELVSIGDNRIIDDFTYIYYDQHQEEKQCIAKTGYDRSINSHTWKKRFLDFFASLNL
jgi:acetyltransferase-like isoleucine patch superfamily enzyme